MAFTGPAEDRQEIRELIETYADAVMMRDAEAWGQVWAEDAFWSLPEFPGHEAFHGRDAIVRGWIASMSQYGSMTDPSIPMVYVATPGAIEVDGAKAKARVYTSELYNDPNTGKLLRVRGRYDDELEKIDGRWLFTRRIYKLVFVG